jgi:NADPH:quinone reductase-like Zn-dependent oxidoreductase
MKAAVYHRYGGAGVVTVAEVPTPVPGAGEVLVRVHAAVVGVTDSVARRAVPAYVRGTSG